jgi:hypothetical protein
VHEKTRTGNWDSDANAMQLELNTFTIGCAAEAESLPGAGQRLSDCSDA